MRKIFTVLTVVFFLTSVVVSVGSAEGDPKFHGSFNDEGGNGGKALKTDMLIEEEGDLQFLSEELLVVNSAGLFLPTSRIIPAAQVTVIPKASIYIFQSVLNL